MAPYDNKPRGPETTHESENSVVRVDASEENGADLGTEMVEGKVAEVAGERTSENKSDARGQGSQAQARAKKDDATGDDRLALRARLLKTAPRETVMRAEVMKALEQKKVQLESDIRAYERRKEYHLLSMAVAQLRAVIRQLEIVARAGYDALKELWLKVVQKFA